LRGISWKKGLQKWRVRLCVDGRDKYIGLFNTQFEAARAYAAAAEHYHGEEYNHGNREWLIKNGARRVAQRRLFRAGNGEWIVANHRWLKDSAQ
jgi:AP2 domain